MDGTSTNIGAYQHIRLKLHMRASTYNFRDINAANSCCNSSNGNERRFQLQLELATRSSTFIN